MADQLVVDWTRPRLTPLQLIPFMPKFVRRALEGDRQRVAETHAVTPTCLLGLFTSALGRGGSVDLLCRIDALFRNGEQCAVERAASHLLLP